MKQIPLTKGFVAIVDDADFDWLNQFKWFAQICDGRPYAARRCTWNGRPRQLVLLHRFILGITDSKIQVDHWNRNTLDYQRNNLRICNATQNGCNKTKSENCSTPFIGVAFVPQLNGINPFLAYINCNRKRTYLGYFSTSEEAARARDVAAKTLHKEFAKLNFP